MTKIPSLYFKKEQRKQLHEFIDFVYDFNMNCNGDSWDDYIQMYIHNEDEGTVVEFEQGFGGARFEWIDDSHYVATSGNEYLHIEEDQTYEVPVEGPFIPGHGVVKGSDIIDLATKSTNEKE